jgi:hypothetical protein
LRGNFVDKNLQPIFAVATLLQSRRGANMQQPPGYPQQPQHPQGPQQAPPGYGQPPQYAMQQQPYYPPKKKGLPGWAWGLIIGAVVLFCGFPVLGLLLVPLVTSNTREARRAEGEQLMGSARDLCRVQHQKAGTAPKRLSAISRPGEFIGLYYQIDDAIESTSTQGKLHCSPMQSPSDGRGHIEFKWQDGSSSIRWD